MSVFKGSRNRLPQSPKKHGRQQRVYFCGVSSDSDCIAEQRPDTATAALSTADSAVAAASTFQISTD